MRTPEAPSRPLWQPRLPAILALAVLLAASASAQVATDPPGDAIHSTLVGDAGEAPASADLLSLAIVDDGDLVWTVTFAAGPQALDEVDTTIAFGHGSRVYHVVASESIGLWISDEAGVAQRYLGDLEGARNGAVLTFRLPTDVVRDEAGMPISDGSRLTGIVVTTSARGEVQGPDPEQGFFCCTAWWTMHDRMPDEAGAAYRVEAGGNATGVRLWSDAPLRASNGGGDRFVYLMTAANGGNDVALPVTISDVPEGWNISAPQGLLDLESGQARTFPILVETPSGHRHGGTETFVVHLANGAQTRIGIHYLDVPQPAGHHPRLFFHSQALEGGVIEEAGYAAGRLWMNTLDEDPLDDGVPIDSTESSFGGESARWSICLSEGLRLGLDLSDATGELDVSLAAQRPYGDVRVSGSIYHYGPGPAQAACDAAAYRAQRNETLVASIPLTDAKAVDGSTRFMAPVVPEAARIAYQDGAMLVLDIVATFTAPDSQAPGPLVIEGGGITLPLDEYREGGDVKIPSWEREDLALVQEPLDDAPARGNDSPAGLLAVAGLLAAACARRR